MMTIFQISKGTICVDLEFNEILQAAYDLGEKNVGGGTVGVVIAYPLIKLFGMFGAAIAAIGTAILLLIFKDTILGFVAGIQLAQYDMVRNGDWITIPGTIVDGVVSDVSLNTVKVRNYDNTLIMLPPYTLVSQPIQNWRGMQESGGRRIKRSLNIDITSIAFTDSAMIESLRNNEATRDLINNIATETIEGKQLTNIDLYIRCINRYIDVHPRVNHTMLAMVRQLQPTEWGLPIELYFFTADVNWVPHEHLQTEVMSHVMALAPLFGIRIYQAPSTVDLRR
jgi:miniconductance mechanosensitive channel